jgi:hypothetical protein
MIDQEIYPGFVRAVARGLIRGQRLRSGWASVRRCDPEQDGWVVDLKGGTRERFSSAWAAARFWATLLFWEVAEVNHSHRNGCVDKTPEMR